MKSIVITGLSLFALLIAAQLATAQNYDGNYSGDDRAWYVKQTFPDGSYLMQGDTHVWHVAKVRDNCHGWRWKWTKVQPSAGVLKYDKDWKINGIKLLGETIDLDGYMRFTNRFDIPTPYRAPQGQEHGGQAYGQSTFLRGSETRQQGFASNQYPGGTTPAVYGGYQQAQVDDLAAMNLVHESLRDTNALHANIAARESYLAERKLALAEKKLESDRQVAIHQISMAALQNRTDRHWEQGSTSAPFGPSAPASPAAPASGGQYYGQAGRGPMSNADIYSAAFNLRCANCHAGARAKSTNLEWRTMVALAKQNPTELGRLAQQIEFRTDHAATADKQMPPTGDRLPPPVRESMLTALDSLMPQIPQAQPPAPLPPEPQDAEAALPPAAALPPQQPEPAPISPPMEY